MQLEIIGSGEAYDPHRINASVLVSEGDYRLLIDCGPTVPQALWRRDLAVDDIDTLYFTHIHPDHASGLVALLNQWDSARRERPLRIICHPKHRAHLQWMADYAAWPSQLCFNLVWDDAFRVTTIGPWQVRTAPTRHSIDNLSLRLDGAGSLFYSGDGRPTESSKALMRGAVVAMQECFSFAAEGDSSQHGDLPNCLQLTEATDARLLLYHIEYGYHARVAQAIQQLPQLVVAEDAQVWSCITGQRLTTGGACDVTDAG